MGGGDLNAPLLPPKPLREQAKALFQYEAQNDDELTFKAGDILNVISKDIEDKGWWKGELNGRIGVFPDNFVELIKPPPSSAENDMSSRPRKRYDLHKPPPPPPNKHASSTTNPPSTGLPLAKSESKGDVAGNNGSAKGASLSGKPATASPDSSYIEEINKYIVSNPLFIEKTSKFGRGNSVNNFVKTGNLNSQKPDVVPQEIVSSSNINKDDIDMDSNDNGKDNSEMSSSLCENSGDVNLGSLDSCGKLTHLTVNRARAPRDRRPPSVIGALRDSDFEGVDNKQQQNGDTKSESGKNEPKSDVKVINSIAGGSAGGESNSKGNAPVPPMDGGIAEKSSGKTQQKRFKLSR